MNYCKLQIDFDRNSAIGKERMSAWIEHLLGRFPFALVDLLAIKDDLLLDVPLVNQTNDSTRSLGGSIAEFVGIKSVDTYLCYKISNIAQFERLCDHYCYTFPKVYRFARSDNHYSEDALDVHLIDEFQYSEIEELSESFFNPLIVRDGPHEMWFDILVEYTELVFLEHSLKYLH